MSRIAAVAVLALACGEPPELAQPWHLDHDRVIAVRVTPPVARPGERAWIDGLVTRKGGSAREHVPDHVEVLGGDATLALDSGRWFVSATRDSAAPIELAVTFGSLVARKTLSVGGDARVPEIREVRAGERDITAVEDVAVTTRDEVGLRVAARDDEDVAWLTSCGPLVDHDLASAYLTVDKRGACELVVVLRAGTAVAWQRWTITPQ